MEITFNRFENSRVVDAWYNNDMVSAPLQPEVAPATKQAG